MTETEVKLCQLQQSIQHLAEISEAGWILKWGDAPENSFELVCRKANALQVEKLESAVDQAYQQLLSSR